MAAAALAFFDAAAGDFPRDFFGGRFTGKMSSLETWRRADCTTSVPFEASKRIPARSSAGGAGAGVSSSSLLGTSIVALYIVSSLGANAFSADIVGLSGYLTREFVDDGFVSAATSQRRPLPPTGSVKERTNDGSFNLVRVVDE